MCTGFFVGGFPAADIGLSGWFSFFVALERTAMDKLDLTKKYKRYYTAELQPEVVDIGPVGYLSITGQGDPSDPAFGDRIKALYSTAYTIKFMYKLQGNDFTVAKLEGLWWYDLKRYGGMAMNDAPTAIPRSEWEYRLLIRLPEYVLPADVKHAAAEVVSKKGIALAGSVSFHTLTEGKCVQMLHLGPFDKEPDTLAQLLSFCKEHGFRQNGLHHEIYLSDFRKTAPEKLRTILREPVR